jgi:hypothetical protein
MGKRIFSDALPDFCTRVPSVGMPAQQKEEAFRNRCAAAAQLTVTTLDLRYVSRRV